MYSIRPKVVYILSEHPVNLSLLILELTLISSRPKRARVLEENYHSPVCVKSSVLYKIFYQYSLTSLCLMKRLTCSLFSGYNCITALAPLLCQQKNIFLLFYPVDILPTGVVSNHHCCIKHSETGFFQNGGTDRKLTNDAYNVEKNVCNRFGGLCHFLSALHSHWRAEMLKHKHKRLRFKNNA